MKTVASKSISAAAVSACHQRPMRSALHLIPESHLQNLWHICFRIIEVASIGLLLHLNQLRTQPLPPPPPLLSSFAKSKNHFRSVASGAEPMHFHFAYRNSTDSLSSAIFLRRCPFQMKKYARF